MKKAFSFFLFFFPLLVLQGQEIDSTRIKLNQTIENANSVKEKTEALVAAGNFFLDKELELSKRYYNKAEQIVTDDDIKNLSVLNEKLAVLYRKKGKYSEATKYGLQAKQFYEQLKDTSGIVRSLISLGITGRFRNKNKEAIEYFNKAVQLSTKKNLPALLGQSYNMKGIAFRRLKKLDSAMINYQKALNIFSILKEENQIVSVNNNLAILYSTQGDYNKSLPILLTYLKYNKEHKNLMSIAIGYFNVAMDYYKKKDDKNSYKYIDSSLVLSKKHGFQFRVAKAFELKSKIKDREGDYKEALEFSNLYHKMTDSIFSLESEKKLREFELSRKFDLERKELEILTKEQEEKTRLYILILVLVSILGTIITYLTIKNYKGKNKYLATKVDKQKLQKELLDEQVKVAEAELKWLVADNSMRLSYLEEFSNKLKEDIKESKETETKSYIKSLLLTLQQQISTEEKHTTVQNKIEEVNKGFYIKLLELYPNLTKSEREVCALLRLNLSIKEMAAIRNTTIDAIKSVRYRLRKKLNIPKQIELESFVQSL